MSSRGRGSARRRLLLNHAVRTPAAAAAQSSRFSGVWAELVLDAQIQVFFVQCYLTDGGRDEVVLLL